MVSGHHSVQIPCFGTAKHGFCLSASVWRHSAHSTPVRTSSSSKQTVLTTCSTAFAKTCMSNLLLNGPLSHSLWSQVPVAIVSQCGQMQAADVLMTCIDEQTRGEVCSTLVGQYSSQSCHLERCLSSLPPVRCGSWYHAGFGASFSWMWLCFLVPGCGSGASEGYVRSVWTVHEKSLYCASPVLHEKSICCSSQVFCVIRSCHACRPVSIMNSFGSFALA